MTRLSARHPRYRSLRTRAGLAEASRQGMVVPEGLIAHGRGEAFDYFLGERTTPSAARAERVAAAWLLAARHPVLSVNGNVAALAAKEVAEVGRSVPGLRVEVNLFHRSVARARAISDRLKAAGVTEVLGVRPTGTIPGLPSDRARVDRRGILVADVCLVPLEDGDRAEALRARGIRVISIDLNPLSRTSQTADLPIVDELTRALPTIARQARRLLRGNRPTTFEPVDAGGILEEARRTMARRLKASEAPVRSGRAARAERPSRRRIVGRSRRRR
jgi:4-phosphopantoate--beta-alanine ligase